jgi:putative transposase
MDSGNTVIKSKKIRIYLKAEQRTLINKWLGSSRYLFNKTVEILKDGTVKANWKAIKTGILHDLPDWCKAIPDQIKSIAIKDACAAVGAAKKEYKKTGHINRVKFISRKNPIQSCYIPKSAVSDKGIYYTKLGELTFSEPLPQKICDGRLVRTNGNYYLVVPDQATIQKTENQGRVVALDPGVRTFLTFFSESSVGKIGHGDFSRIQRLGHHLDRLISKISKAKGGQKRRMKKAARRMTTNGKRVLDLCEAYTSKTVSWTGELVNIGGRKTISSKVDGQKMDRDINGDRGIFLRALVDTPWMRNHLALVS